MMWTYIIIALLLLAAELAYFKIADKCNIIDKPNERSSHKTWALDMEYCIGISISLAAGRCDIGGRGVVYR